MENSSTGSATSFSGTVLLVDDDETVIRAVSFLLEALGFDVRSFSNGPDSIVSLQADASEVRCAFIDVTMFGMDGLETRAGLRRVAGQLPVVLTTGFSEQSIPQDVLADPLTKYLKKPYTIDMLTKCLNDLFDVESNT